jgi:hypothetical protein
MSQFKDDDTPIEASFGSAFYNFLVENTSTCDAGDPVCYGTAYQWVLVSFGGEWKYSHVGWNVFYLGGVILVSRILTMYGLAKMNYLAK